MLNKKGLRILSEQMFLMFEIILIGLITVAFMRYVYGFGSSSYFERVWISQDLKMLLETIVSSPQLAVYDYIMPKTETINESNANISITQTLINVTIKESEKEYPLKTTQLYTYSLFRKFSGIGAGTKFRIITNGNVTSLSEINGFDIKQLSCERYKQAYTRSTEKKVLGFNTNPANKRIVELLTDFFTKGLRSGFYEVKDSGKGDLYLHIECETIPKIVINEPKIENQKFACLLAEKIPEINYDDIVQKADENLIGKADVAVRLNFNCDEKRTASIASAIESFYK